MRDAPLIAGSSPPLSFRGIHDQMWGITRNTVGSYSETLISSFTQKRLISLQRHITAAYKSSHCIGATRSQTIVHIQTKFCRLPITEDGTGGGGLPPPPVPLDPSFSGSSSSCKAQATSYTLQATRDKLQAAGCRLQATSYTLQAARCTRGAGRAAARRARHLAPRRRHTAPPWTP